MAQLNQEPSMEDILASIKRIIAEDSEAAATRSPRGKRAPVAVVPDPAPAEPEPEAERESEPEPESDLMPEEPVAAAPVPQEPADVLELTSPLIDPEPETMNAAAATPFAAEPAAPFAPIAAPAPASESEAPAAAPEGPILSGAAAVASRNAFAALNQLQVRADEGKSNTLEGLVADLLRPMLRDWLDRELPGVVERLVQEEIRRVSGRG